MKRTFSLMSAASAFEPGLEGEAVTEHRKRTVSAKAPVEPKQASTLTERPENWKKPKEHDDSEQESFHHKVEARSGVNLKRNRIGFHFEQEEAPCASHGGAFTLRLSPRLPAPPPAFFPASPTPQDHIFVHLSQESTPKKAPAVQPAAATFFHALSLSITRTFPSISWQLRGAGSDTVDEQTFGDEEEEEDDEGLGSGWEYGYKVRLDHLEADVRMNQAGGDLQQQCPDSYAAAAGYFQPGFHQGYEEARQDMNVDEEEKLKSSDEEARQDMNVEEEEKLKSSDSPASHFTPSFASSAYFPRTRLSFEDL